ncbi:MAG TPA: glycoside hydrolase domain-containing protein [Gaiellaceae bacterium]|nr:glycoside hydrolase domain-containing protein [Gaiellaceae bacterium]
MRGVVTLGALAACLVIGTATGAARTAQATVAAYPAGTSFTATGAAPSHGSSSVSLAMPIGAVDDAVILARGAQQVSALSTSIDPALTLHLLFAHYVSVDGKPVPDVLEPWDGSQRTTEKTNQPIWVQITVPQGTTPGTYAGSVSLVTDGTPTVVPISVDVANVTLPPPGQVSGSLLTAFNVSAQSYGNEVHRLYGIPASQSLPGFFPFLASYGISPNEWGYGNPDSKAGYTTSRNWFKDKAARMTDAVGNPRQFGAMAIPISNNRATPHGWTAGISPYEPSTWCSYLKAVKGFWARHGWLPGAYPYLYAMDEPGGKLYPIIRRQAAVAHRCWPGSHVLVTTRPQPSDRFLWNGGKDDIDTFAILESRYYGEYTNPRPYRDGQRRATMFLRYINAARKRGKQIWTYTYESAAHTTPGLAAIEPASAPRMYTAWAALEGITGILRGNSMTAYDPHSNPLDTNNKGGGDYVLIYPGKSGPIASARLEELREGIEDWEILNIVRQKHGSKAVVKLLSHLFSTTATGAKLACFAGCPIKNSLPYSWPLFSHDATTATKIAQMRAKALAAAS